MRLYPAIDLKDKKCVRLCQGVYENKKVYSDSPWEVACDFEKKNAKGIHLVDLDGARGDTSVNEETIKKITESVSVMTEIGGGIRSLFDIEKKLNLGISRVIIGTKALESPEFVRDAIKNFGEERIVVGIDAKNGFVAVNGWEKVTKNEAVSFGIIMREMGVKTIIYTDISKDGMMTGPNVTETENMITKTGINIVASGGVSGICDLRHLNKIGASGVILGKALYENKIDLKEAIKEFENE